MSNLTEYKNLLFKFFLENDKLILPDDFNKLIIVSEFPEFEMEAIKTALSSFEESSLIKKFPFEDGKKHKIGYILNQSLSSYEQQVTVSGDVAFYIADILNKIKGEGSENITNSLNISARDIDEMLIFLNSYLNIISQAAKKNLEND